MKELKSSDLIGKGTKRLVYIDSTDESKCIKILAGKDSVRDAKREEKYFLYLQTKDISWEHMVSYYGRVETDKGEGYSFDLCRDFDGKVSIPLSFYLADQNKFILFNKPLEKIQCFKDYLMDNRIIVGDPNLNNVLYRRISPKEGKLVLVDGMGNSEFIPISNYIDYFAKKKIKRSLKRFEKKLLKHESYIKLIEGK